MADPLRSYQYLSILNNQSQGFRNFLLLVTIEDSDTLDQFAEHLVFLYDNQTLEGWSEDDFQEEWNGWV